MSDDLQRAFTLHRGSQFAAAAELYQRVLAADPEQPDALQLLGLIHVQQGDPARAVELIERAIRARPESAPFYANLAEAYRALGRLEQAAEAAQTAVRLAPSFPAGLANYGIILVAQGRLAEAIEPLRQAVAQVPGLPTAHHSLALALLGLGRPDEAVPHCDAAVRLEPDRAIFHHNRGNCLQALGRLGDAQDAYLEALRLDAKLARPHAHLGYVMHGMGRADQALEQLQQALAQSPDSPAYWEALAELHDQRDEYLESVRCWQRVLALAPDRPHVHRALGQALQAHGKIAEARAQFDVALALEPASPAAHFDLAGYYEVTGDFAAAETELRTALRLQPDNPVPLGQLARLLRGRLPDADLAALEQRLAQAKLSAEVRAHLLFGLAQVLDARGEYPRAAESARQANALTRARLEARGGAYVPAVHELFVSGVCAVHSPEFFARLAGAGPVTRRPVFVFGLPRSGTSLVEQVLASHPAVFGAGEVQLVARTVAAIPNTLGRPGPPLVCIEDLTPAAIAQLAAAHLAELDQLDGGRAARIVDKMPHNYLFLGLLAVLFPQATFVHCRRDLRDVALSCWMTSFRSVEWACDPAHIASRIGQYLRLMAHWRKVLPVPVHEVVYEDFVADLEGGSRRLLAACGLDWDPACLEFHRTTRAVHTASFSQVRQPVYTKSVGRWTHYEQELADLFTLLPS